ncbi:MAG TPA: 50S ribosomal protein L6 [bacterium]|nr:50S ribosomal protein L6 [bacterium]
MARLGKRPINVTEGITVSVADGKVKVESSKGKMEHEIFPFLDISVEGNKVFVKNTVSDKEKKLFRKTEAFQGLLRKIIINMICGLDKGFEKVLEMNGVGYKAEIKEKKLFLSVGFSNPVEMNIPEGVSVEILKNTILFIRGRDIQKVGDYAATIRSVYPPEPYKGKGIRYRGEYVRHKAGKTGVGATQ